LQLYVTFICHSRATDFKRIDNHLLLELFPSNLMTGRTTQLNAQLNHCWRMSAVAAGQVSPSYPSLASQIPADQRSKASQLKLNVNFSVNHQLIDPEIIDGIEIAAHVDCYNGQLLGAERPDQSMPALPGQRYSAKTCAKGYPF
jgi:hypothetical protein